MLGRNGSRVSPETWRSHRHDRYRSSFLKEQEGAIITTAEQNDYQLIESGVCEVCKELLADLRSLEETAVSPKLTKEKMVPMRRI